MTEYKHPVSALPTALGCVPLVELVLPATHREAGEFTRTKPTGNVRAIGWAFPAAVDAPEDPIPEVGLVGRRFPPAVTRDRSTGQAGGEEPRRRARRRSEDGPRGARFPSAVQQRRWMADELQMGEGLDEPPTPEPAAVPGPAWEPPVAPRTEHVPPGEPHLDPPEEPDLGAAEATSALVRPYVLTSGRTRSRLRLAVETLVSTSRNGATRGLDWATGNEQRTVIELCVEPRSVAEVAALLAVPLGVARVLLSDLAEQGAIVVHDVGIPDDGPPELALMQRVLAGLRRL